MNPLPGVHLIFGRYGQFSFHHADRTVLVDGVVRTACRFCGKGITAPRFKFYCGEICRKAFWGQVVPVTDWATIRHQALRRDGHACTLCGARGPSAHLEVDHIQPVAMHPDLEFQLSNVRTLCRSCHARHGWRPSAGRVLTKDLPANQARLDGRPVSRPAAPEAPQGPTPPATIPLNHQGANGARASA